MAQPLVRVTVRETTFLTGRSGERSFGLHSRNKPSRSDLSPTNYNYRYHSTISQ